MPASKTTGRATPKTTAVELAPPPATPTPNTIRAEWFPAAVRLPDMTVVRMVKVFAADTGVYVYTAVPDDPISGLEPAFFSPVHYDKTPTLPPEYAARQVGIQLITDAGPVTVQPLAGCGCTHRALKDWRPLWAGRIEPWRAS